MNTLNWKRMFESAERVNQNVNRFKEEVEAKSVTLYGPNGEKALRITDTWSDLPEGLTATAYDNGFVSVYNADGSEWGCIPMVDFQDLLRRSGYTHSDEQQPVQDAEFTEVEGVSSETSDE